MIKYVFSLTQSVYILILSDADLLLWFFAFFALYFCNNQVVLFLFSICKTKEFDKVCCNRCIKLVSIMRKIVWSIRLRLLQVGARNQLIRLEKRGKVDKLYRKGEKGSCRQRWIVSPFSVENLFF